MLTCGSQLGAGGDITPRWLMTAHWDLRGGGRRGPEGSLVHKSIRFCLCLWLAWLGLCFFGAYILVCHAVWKICGTFAYSFPVLIQVSLFSSFKVGYVSRVSSAAEQIGALCLQELLSLEELRFVSVQSFHGLQSCVRGLFGLTIMQNTDAPVQLFHSSPMHCIYLNGTRFI